MDKRIIMKKSKQNGILLFIFCLNSLSFFAQEGTNFNDNVEDVPTAPIDNWIPYMILLVIAYGCIISNKSKKVTQ
jgi:hypothetical protein